MTGLKHIFSLKSNETQSAHQLRPIQQKSLKRLQKQRQLLDAVAPPKKRVALVDKALGLLNLSREVKTR